MNTLARLILFTCAAPLAAAPLTIAQVELQTFVADEPHWGEQLGRSVAIDGDALAISRPGADLDGIPDRGSILVYRWTAGTWALEQEVVAPDAGPWDQLTACALSGDVLVAGAPSDDVAGAEDAGSVHVFVRDATGWEQSRVLVAPDGLTGDAFGSSVALSDDVLVVGAPLADYPLQADRGRIYSYRRIGGSWVLEAIKSYGSSESAHFGHSVDVDGDVLVVGAPGAEPTGRAYVLRYDSFGWGLAQTLLNPVQTGPSSFGTSVAVRGSLLAVGSPLDSLIAQWAGRVSCYRDVGAGFSPIQGQGTPTAFAGFGSSVDLTDEWLAIGSPHDSGVVSNQGAVFLRRWDAGTQAWAEQHKFFAAVSSPFSCLGEAVAVDGPLVIGGSPMQLVSATGQEGEARVFSSMPAAWGYAGGGLAGVHGVPDFTGRGTLLPGSPMTLGLHAARESAPAALFIGTSQLGAPFKGGTLVPAPTLIIFLATNAAGDLVLNATWPSSIPQGFTLWLQTWIQDASAVANWAASNALSATQP